MSDTEDDDYDRQDDHYPASQEMSRPGFGYAEPDLAQSSKKRRLSGSAAAAASEDTPGKPAADAAGSTSRRKNKTTFVTEPGDGLFTRKGYHSKMVHDDCPEPHEFRLGGVAQVRESSPCAAPAAAPLTPRPPSTSSTRRRSSACGTSASSARGRTCTPRPTTNASSTL